MSLSDQIKISDVSCLASALALCSELKYNTEKHNTAETGIAHNNQTLWSITWWVLQSTVHSRISYI